MLLVSYFLLTWLSGYFGRKVINKLDWTWFDLILLWYNVNVMQVNKCMLCNCLEWYKWVLTNLYHNRQLYLTHLSHRRTSRQR